MGSVYMAVLNVVEPYRAEIELNDGVYNRAVAVGSTSTAMAGPIIMGER